jgi:asparagine synthase (glutamine-hydrolysing)
MEHETWYRSGIWVCDELPAYVGWTNYGGDFADCMPVFNESRDVALFLAGEVFPEAGVIRDLRNNGHQFSNGNASYLAHLYEEKGDDFVGELNGSFSGVLLDCRKRRVVLFNDRYGMHRTFIHENREGLFFASEAKCLLAVLPEVRGFDPKGLGEFLTCGCTLGRQSLYKNVSVLPPASVWVAEDGEVKKKASYFRPEEWIDRDRLNEKEFSSHILDMFGGVVGRYVVGSLPVGISLTGGLDSRVVMACLGRGSGEFPCYTFGSMYRDTFDVQIAREVARMCGRPHHVFVLGEDFLRDFPRYLEKAVYISDGYIGLSGAAELYANSMAKAIAPVRLTGNYGGEVLRGERAFKHEIPQGTFVSAELQLYLREAQATFEEHESTDGVTFALFHQAPSQGYGRLAVERSQVLVRTSFMDNDLVKLVYQAPSHLLRGQRLSVAIILRYNPDLLSIPTDRGLDCAGSPLRTLAKRFHREALFKAEYWSNKGLPTWLAAISRLGLLGVLDKSFLGRHKFQHLRLWTQERLGGYITDVLIEGSKDLGQFFDLRQVENMVQEHVAGRRNYVNEIDKLLTITLAQCTLLRGGGEFGSGRPGRTCSVVGGGSIREA